MSYAEWGLIGLLALGAVQQLAATALFLLRYRRQSSRTDETPPRERMPPAVVILPIRGADDRLRETCRGLKSQSYPCMRVRVILDDPEGTVEPLLREELGDDERFEIHPLEKRRDTCGLKNSAVLQATEALPADCEVVAFVDSDVIPHGTWLEELVRPIANEEADGSYGCRWYALEDRRLGSVWRYAWCAASLVSTLVRNVPWGGSLAVRKDILKEPKLRGLWANSGCEDLPLSAYLRKSGRILKGLPALLMVERSSCSVSSYRTFVGRQMLWARLYRPDAFWPAASIYLAAAISLWGLSALGLWRLLRGEFAQFGILAAVLSVYAGLALFLVWIIERCARRLAGDRLGPSMPLGLRGRCAILASLWLSPDTLMLAIFTKCLTWRGVTYDVHLPYGIRLLSDSFSKKSPATADSRITPAPEQAMATSSGSSPRHDRPSTS